MVCQGSIVTADERNRVDFAWPAALALACLLCSPATHAQAEAPGAEPRVKQGNETLKAGNPNISEAIRASRDPLDARFSGRMYRAVRAALSYRSSRQGARLRPTERVIENFVFSVRTGPESRWLRKDEQQRCFEVFVIPQVAPGEEVMLDKADMKLGRYAIYIVCDPTYSVVKDALGSEELRAVEIERP
jgi:hypothetical protein